MSSKRLSAIHAVQGIAFGLLMPFLVPLLAGRGLGAAQLGFVLGAAGVAAPQAYPLWGAMARLRFKPERSTPRHASRVGPRR